MGSIQRICIAWIFLFVSMIVYASMAKAEVLVPVPEPLVGTYSFSDNIEGVMLLDVKVVYGFTKEGRAQLQELRSSGYACEAKPRQTYRCTDHLEIQRVNDEIKEKVFRKMNGLTWVEFKQMAGSVDLETDGESFKMWRVNRVATTPESEYKSYEYTWTPSIEKVILRDESDALAPVYFNVVDEDTLSMQMSVSKTYSRQHFQIFIVSAAFEKGQ